MKQVKIPYLSSSLTPKQVSSYRDTTHSSTPVATGIARLCSCCNKHRQLAGGSVTNRGKTFICKQCKENSNGK